jgi:hypothetical protein
VLPKIFLLVLLSGSLSACGDKAGKDPSKKEISYCIMLPSIREICCQQYDSHDDIHKVPILRDCTNGAPEVINPVNVYIRRR